MAVAERTIVTYVCDRCGYETTESMDLGRFEWLERKRTFKRFDGRIGESTDSLWLCGWCSGALSAFLKGKPT